MSRAKSEKVNRVLTFSNGDLGELEMYEKDIAKWLKLKISSILIKAM
jgi:hypothetical protein